MKIVGVSEMQELDRNAIENIGIPSIVLMENAGQRVSEIAIDMLGGGHGKKVAVFCGTGNNGGDGFVAARHLSSRGIKVDVCVVGDSSRIKNDPAINLNILEKMGVKVKELALPLDKDSDLVIDGIFGIGLKGEVKDSVRFLIRELNKQDAPIFSIDVPSGLDADTGRVLGEAIKAKKTITMQFPKKGFYINKGPEHAGEIIVADIGIPG
ncbi:NAD(P)H-hydrate epimerase [Candidatus Omnitrophota bacterium]